MYAFSNPKVTERSSSSPRYTSGGPSGYKLPGFQVEPVFFNRGGEVPSNLRLKHGGVIFNNKPRDLTAGGPIKKSKKMTKTQLQNDSVKTYLQPGQLVIPTKYAELVNSFLKDNPKLFLYGRKNSAPSSKVKAITQPGEIVIDKHSVTPVIKFLKSKNIFLPNT